jgi:hypothetical protein
MVNAFLKDPEPGKPSKMKLPKESKNPRCKYLDSYTDMIIFTRREAPDTFKIRKGEEFVLWALSNPKATRPRQFWHKQGIHIDVVKDWAKKNEVFNKLYDFGLQELGDHREEKAETREMPERVFFHSIPHYLPEMKELEEWRSALKTLAEDGDNEPLKILIERFSSKAKENREE